MVKQWCSWYIHGVTHGRFFFGILLQKLRSRHPSRNALNCLCCLTDFEVLWVGSPTSLRMGRVFQMAVNFKFKFKYLNITFPSCSISKYIFLALFVCMTSCAVSKLDALRGHCKDYFCQHLVMFIVSLIGCETSLQCPHSHQSSTDEMLLLHTCIPNL